MLSGVNSKLLIGPFPPSSIPPSAWIKRSWSRSHHPNLSLEMYRELNTSLPNEAVSIVIRSLVLIAFGSTGTGVGVATTIFSTSFSTIFSTSTSFSTTFSTSTSLITSFSTIVGSAGAAPQATANTNTIINAGVNANRSLLRILGILMGPPKSNVYNSLSPF